MIDALVNEISIDYSALLAGKKAFVTTASQGVGKAIALLFAKHGATVIIGGRNLEKTQETIAEIKAISPGSKAYIFDLSQKNQVEETCDKILEEFGYIDVLVNTVGVNLTSSLHKAKDEDIEYMLNANFKSGVYCARKFLPGMIERKSGNVVNISSIHSLQTNGDCTVYAATKAAVNGVTRAMAVDYAPYGIRVNAVLPGLIMSDNIVAGAKAQKDVAAYAEVLKGAQPLPPGQSQDVANAALFLASDMSAYVTGHTLLVDGGARARIKW